MIFTSFSYLLFLPVVLGLYYLLPERLKNPMLLGASYVFYMCWNAAYALLMLLSTVLTYGCALLVEKRLLGKRKLWLALCLGLNLGILFLFKYFNFFSDVFAWALGTGTGAHFSLLLPVGISFYTFQALGYAVDVYRGDIPAEKNFITYALFVSFFPQLVAGPIERSGAILPQLREKHPFAPKNLAAGSPLLCWGFFKKMVLADNLAVLVNTAYGMPETASAFQLTVATVAFAFQIYCDFSAYSDIARGSARLFGITLMENFDRPYLSPSIREFWQRWHISLSNWFRDYLYFPLGGSRVSAPRKLLNLLIVFLLSGLWHGAAATYVCWGLLHGLYRVAGELLREPKKRLRAALHIPEGSRWMLGLSILCTFALTCFAWIFFRAGSLPEAVTVIGQIFSFAPGDVGILDQITALGLSQRTCLAAGACLLALALTEVSNGERRLRGKMAEGPFLRYGVCLLLICATLLFGVYGVGVSAQAFVYFQF